MVGKLNDKVKRKPNIIQLRLLKYHRFNLQLPYFFIYVAVTPEHVVPQVVEAIALAVEGGLRVPIVYNTSSYDSMRSLEVGFKEQLHLFYVCYNQNLAGPELRNESAVILLERRKPERGKPEHQNADSAEK